LCRFGLPFDLAPPRSISSSLLLRPPHPIILPTPFTRKLLLQDEGESWMSSLEESTPVDGRKQEEDSKLLALGCPQASSLPSSSTTFSGVSITHMCFNPCKMMGKCLHSSLGLDECMICNLYMNLMPINALWSMPLRMLCLHMFAQHVVLVGFVVIVVICLTLWMLRYRCSYM
jgi:hypothetical protein